MTDLAYTGFCYRWDRSDARAPNCMLTMHCLVIARSASEAERVLAETVTGPGARLQLISSGTKMLEEAKRRGLNPGEGEAL